MTARPELTGVADKVLRAAQARAEALATRDADRMSGRSLADAEVTVAGETAVRGRARLGGRRAQAGAATASPSASAAADIRVS
jgi:hypothetical protein